MKKFLLFSTIFFSSIFLFSNVEALSSAEESKLQTFYDDYYDQEYPNCVYVSMDYGYIVCLKSSDLSTFSIKSNGNWYKFDLDNSSVVQYTSISSKKIFNTSIRNITYVNAYVYFNPSHLSSNFDFYAYDEDNNQTLVTKNFYFRKLAVLTFDLPEGYSVVLKDKDNKIIDQTGDNKYVIYYGNYTYSIYFNNDLIIENENLSFSYENVIKPIKKVAFNFSSDSDFLLKDVKGNIITPVNGFYYLPSGNYIYSLSKPGYFSKDNELITIDDDSVINLTLESKYNPNDMQSIFTQFYNYIKNLVIDIFPLENPLFIYLISITIGFFLIALIRKLIGGII